ncbi:MAG: PAS domain S-box protein, partial [Proteobacteria bacterium]|nr:PAS domain S-box protein [Pseudomonadota bacterium]
MTVIGIADVLSAAGFLGALALVPRVPRRVLPKECRVLLGVCLGIYGFVGVSNLCQSVGLTEALDVYEDYAELLFIPFFAYFVYAYGTAAEIGRRRATEAALRQSEERYRALVDNVDMGISLIDASFRVVMANPAQRRLFRGAAERPDEQFCFRTFGKRQEVCPVCPGRRAMETQQPQTEVVEHRREDGTPLTVRIHAFPTPGADGSPGGFIEVVEDVTEQRRAEQALREAEDRLHQVVDAAFEGIAVSEAGRFVEVNDGFASAFGFTPAELLGTEVLDRVAPEARPDVAEKLRSGYDRPYESLCMRRDGSRFPVEVCGKGITYQGRPARVTALRDLTQRKRAEEERRRLEDQMQQAQKLESLGVLAGGIAHDFNNLLMGIMGNADLTLLRLEREAPERAYVERIVASAQRAAGLTRQMLEYAGQSRFQIAPLDLPSVLQDMRPLLAAAVSKKAELQLQVPAELPSVSGDASQLRQVVMNLVTNASEALGTKPGIVAVSAGVMDADATYLAGTHLSAALSPGPYAYVEVSDSGCGMTQETLDRLFDPFFSTKFLGRGLGLAAVLGIVRAHGGAIRVWSEPGRGTTVRILLPLSSAAGDPHAPGAPGEEAAATSPG